MRRQHNLSEDELRKLRFALALKKLLQESNLDTNSKGIDMNIKSLGQLSSVTGLRRATLSAVFNGDSNPSIVTIIIIIEGLQKTFSQFATYIDTLTNADLLDYHREIQANKKSKTRRK